MSIQEMIFLWSYGTLFLIVLFSVIILNKYGKIKIANKSEPGEVVTAAFIIAGFNPIVIGILIIYWIVIKPLLLLATPSIDEIVAPGSKVDYIEIRPPKITSYKCEYCNQINSIKIIKCPNCGASNEKSRI